ncbi:hypothetical protein BDF20DRAFT_529717 [Mycotypha africana]|uniref:uncharacterized protein n=1 Tax=Mycotypha africana TaxID=64632 RepID=UPI00230169DA|nr:uncharacterized protein BDF20DRAFT_529717 [Mycotypha africana]KAI8979754.1 hypothetical protein BDF20DRAFT_529717 [Mycotypha africana]
MGDTAQQQPSRSSSSTLPMSFIVRPQSKPVLKTTELSETAAKNSSNSNDTDAESLVSSKMSPTTQKDGDTTAVATAQMQVHSTDSTMMASSIKQTNEGRQLLAEASPDTSPNVSEKRQSGSLKMTTDENSRPQGVDTITKDKGKDKADIPHTTLLYPPSVPNRTTKELSTARLSSQHLPSQKRPSLSLSKTKTIEQRQQLQETPLRQSPHHLFHQTLTVQEERLYLQSTPQRGNGVVHAHTIFGDDLPFSPIRGTSTSGVLNSSSSTATQNHAATSIHHISNIAYPDTPMLASGRLRPFGQQTSSLASPSTVPHTPSRLSHQRPLQSSSTGTTLTRDEQGEEENGKQKGRQLPLERPNLPSLDDIPPPDVSNFVLTLSEKEKNMTVEEFIQAIIDTNVQKVKERGEDMMKQIRARSDQVKIQLLKQKGQLR